MEPLFLLYYIRILLFPVKCVGKSVKGNSFLSYCKDIPVRQICTV